MKKIRFIALLAILSVAAMSVGCKEDKGTPDSGTTPVQIRLTDAPGPYDAVYINILSIALHVTREDYAGWVDVQMPHPGVYNLLDFRNGVDTLVANHTIPCGQISQIRLLLAEEGNSVVKDGQSHPLSTPSAQQSGLKLNLHDVLVADVAYRLWIDFDASRSIVQTGSGKYQLKPVIRTYTEATGGSLRGTVLPQAANTIVWAILGSDSVAAYPDSFGHFLIPGLSPSTSWKVSFDADAASGYTDVLRAGVMIRPGEVTDLGVVTLQKP